MTLLHHSSSGIAEHPERLSYNCTYGCLLPAAASSGRLVLFARRCILLLADSGCFSPHYRFVGEFSSRKLYRMC